MKHILFFAFLFTSACSTTAQRVEIVKHGGTDYIVQRDTSTAGEITIRQVPVANALKEITRKLEIVEGRISEINSQIATLTDERKKLQADKKELEKIITALRR
jgi:peptidoglycan hydrolase CwlO-like protein